MSTNTKTKATLTGLKRDPIIQQCMLTPKIKTYYGFQGLLGDKK